MVNKSKQLDYAGNTLIVDSINVGATKSGQQGTALSGSEIALLDGVTAGTVTAGKAVVAAESTKNIGTFGSVTATSFVVDAASDITIPSAAVATAGTGAGSAGNASGAVATHVLPITVGATTYYIPLCNTNA